MGTNHADGSNQGLKMKSIIIVMKVLMLMVSLTVLLGCATTAKPLTKNDLLALSPLKVIRFDTPEIERYTWGGFAKSLLLPTSWMSPYGMLGGLGRQAVAREEGSALKEKCKLSDYGQLVMNKFAEKVVKEIPSWPKMTIEDKPMEADYKYKAGNVLSFNVLSIHLWSLGVNKGLTTVTTADIRTSTGHLIWHEQSKYSQKKASREQELDEMEANDCKLLKEEMDYAADKTAAEFIEDIKGGSQL